MHETITDIINLPNVEDEELGLVVFGKDSEFGESILLHVPHERWIVVDSFYYQNQPIVLWYCNQKNIDPKTSISHVVCTHWHNDHIGGLNDVLIASENAQFIYTKYSARFLKNVYLKLQQRDCLIYAGDDKKTKYELTQCLKTATQRNFEHRLAKRNAVPRLPLISPNAQNNNTLVECLSPSEAASEDYDKLLVNLKRDKGKAAGEIINKDSENITSIAIGVKSDIGQIFLGGDLECNVQENSKKVESLLNAETIRRNNMWNQRLTTCSLSCNANKKYGLCNIINEVDGFDSYKFNLVKFPHHGSITSFCPRFWKDSVTNDVIGGVVCCGRSYLPDPWCIDKISSLVNDLYISNQSRYDSLKIKTQQEHDTVKLFNDAKAEVLDWSEEQIGIIVFKKKVNADWNVFTYGAAGKILNSENRKKIVSIVQNIETYARERNKNN